MKKIFFLGALLLLITISCTKKREYYNNGNISKEYKIVDGKMDGEYREYYPNKNLKKLCYYSKGVLKDSLIYYYDNEQNSINYTEYFLNNDTLKQVFYRQNGTKEKEGQVLRNKIRIGNWFFYHDNAVISQKIEFFNIAGKEYLNQCWYYNKEGKELKDSGNYITIETKKDTVKIDEPLVFLISLVKPYFSYKSNVYACLPKNKLSDLEQDFSNLKHVSLDTFHSVKTEKIVKDSYKYNRQVSFGLTFSKVGEVNIRGFLTEKYPNDGNFGIDKKYEILERKIYFNKKIYIQK